MPPGGTCQKRSYWRGSVGGVQHLGGYADVSSYVRRRTIREWGSTLIAVRAG